MVGSPSTLGADKVWRAWLAWVRDRGAFLTPNALPQLPWEAAAAAEAERTEVHLRALEVEAGADSEVADPTVDPIQDPEEEVVASAARASGRARSAWRCASGAPTPGTAQGSALLPHRVRGCAAAVAVTKGGTLIASLRAVTSLLWR